MSIFCMSAAIGPALAAQAHTKTTATTIAPATVHASHPATMIADLYRGVVR